MTSPESLPARGRSAVSGSLRMRLDAIQPSQLYISSLKLQQVRQAWDPGRPGRIEPIPVRRGADCVFYTDGHTRALAAWLDGQTEVEVTWDADELDWEAYDICVAWCRQAGIFTIADLQDRVVDPQDYERLWHDRCRVMQADLEAKRRRQAPGG